MPIITVRPSGNSFEASPGTSLLNALLAAGEAIEHKCEGDAKCGSCHLFVHEGRKSLSKIARIENERLDTLIGIGSKSRLACQALLGEEDVTVELLGFASGF
jgi:2Fe-2S ferredoxin